MDLLLAQTFRFTRVFDSRGTESSGRTSESLRLVEVNKNSSI